MFSHVASAAELRTHEAGVQLAAHIFSLNWRGESSQLLVARMEAKEEDGLDRYATRVWKRPIT